MHERDVSYSIYAFAVLAFAGLSGLSTVLGAVAAGDPPNLPFLVLTLLCLPSALSLAWRLVPGLHAMAHSTAPAERRVGRLWLSAMSCGLLGGGALALLASDANAMLDSRNDWMVYGGCALLGTSFLLAFLGSVMVRPMPDNEA